MQLIGDKYFATWIIDEVKCAAQQLNYGQEHPFHIFCSTENLKFIGDNWPYQENYGLWDYVTYTPYSYSIAPVEPSTQTNPIDETLNPIIQVAKYLSPINCKSILKVCQAFFLIFIFVVQKDYLDW